MRNSLVDTVGDTEDAMKYWATLHINDESEAHRLLAESINESDIHKLYIDTKLIRDYR